MAFNPPVVDNFTGSDGSIDNRVSSAGPIWAAPGVIGDTAATITTNTVRTGTVGTWYGAALDSLQYGPDVEVAVTITQLASGSQVDLDLFSNGYNSFPATDGDGNMYVLVVEPGSGGAPGAYTLYRRIGTTRTDLIAQPSTTNFAAPESVGLGLVEEATGTRCRIWRKMAGVWTEEYNFLDTNGSRPSGQRYVGFSLETDGTTLVIDDFMVQTTAGAGVPVAWYGAAG